jgi:disulfide bond formation protein DsbB
MSQQKILISLLLAAIIALSSAYIAQYFFDLQPCILCLYQRPPFFIIIAISALALISKNKKLQQASFFLILICLLANVAIATYQTGVEQKIFRGPDSCSANEHLNEITDLDALREAMLKTKAVRCDEPQFFFLKLSMAAWNVIFCSTLAFLMLLLRYRNRRASNF